VVSVGTKTTGETVRTSNRVNPFHRQVERLYGGMTLFAESRFKGGQKAHPITLRR